MSSSPKQSHSKYTIEYANEVLRLKKVDGYLSVCAISGQTLTLLDRDYGTYTADIKSLCPSMAVPLHKSRRHSVKLAAFTDRVVGTKINGIEIVGAFYGPARGYKNRTFYLECKGICGHIFVSSNAHLQKHRKGFECFTCVNAQVEHGARAQKDGVRLKRSYTYLQWMRLRKTLPPEYQEFGPFMRAAGECPYKRANLVFEDGKPVWIDRLSSEDAEIQLIASALRSSFRHSALYKAALKAAEVQTATGTRYRCALCSELFPLIDVQVDHVTPVAPLDGTPVTKAEIIDRVWTNNIQVLDRSCHSKKSSAENKARRLSKSRAK